MKSKSAVSEIPEAVLTGIWLAEVGRQEERLDASELARANAISNPQTRIDFVAGRLALRQLLAAYLDVAPARLSANFRCPDCGVDEQNSHGRPDYLVDGKAAPLTVSFSRSHGWGVAALIPAAKALLGVDVQRCQDTDFPGYDGVALSPREELALAQLTAVERQPWRARVWARKEALLKADGRGLRIDPRRTEAFPEKANESGSEIRVGEINPPELGLPADFAVAVALLRKPLQD